MAEGRGTQNAGIIIGAIGNVIGGIGKVFGSVLGGMANMTGQQQPDQDQNPSLLVIGSILLGAMAFLVSVVMLAKK